MLAPSVCPSDVVPDLPENAKRIFAWSATNVWCARKITEESSGLNCSTRSNTADVMTSPRAVKALHNGWTAAAAEVTSRTTKEQHCAAKTTALVSSGVREFADWNAGRAAMHCSSLLRTGATKLSDTETKGSNSGTRPDAVSRKRCSKIRDTCTKCPCSSSLMCGITSLRGSLSVSIAASFATIWATVSAALSTINCSSDMAAV
mmetsp:Transcript_95339/g.308895  ORF Transcript_95339/g.308895 Transcript_95339/m.308895 type:complete len:204 (+) Transcript_95339:1357-1968(+)